MRTCRFATILIAASISFISCGSPGPQEQGAGLARVTVDPALQRVSIDAKDASVKALLSELAKQAHLTVSIPDDMKSERLTLAFQNVPLEEALKRVLAGQSYTFAYKQDKGREVISGVRLFAKHEQIPPTGSAPSGMPALAQLTGSQGLPTPLPTTRSWGRGGSTMNEKTVAAVSDDVPLDELKRSFSETKDPALRSATLEAMVDRGEEGPVAPILSTALSDSDEDVRATALDLLRSASEPVPLGPLAQMAGTDNNPDLRIEAMTLMADQLLEEGRTKEEWGVVRASLDRSLSDPNPDVREQAEMLLSDLSQ